MKTLIICLGVLSLLFNLANGGYIGKVKLPAPSNLTFSVTEDQQDDQEARKLIFVQNIFVVVLLFAYLLEIARHSHHRSVEVEVPHPGKITLCSHLCSSGGLPW